MERFIDKFVNYYGFEPTAAAYAPGRLEILGNHTDYNQGRTLSCAVGQKTRFALRPNGGVHCRIKDFRSGDEMKFDLSRPDAPPPRNGSRYIKGVSVELMKFGAELGGFDAAIESDIPLSAGMSSSAALELSAALAIGVAFGIDMQPGEWARLGQLVENDYLGLQTGLLDQFSSIFGKQDSMILSDFRSQSVERTVALPPGYSIVVINSMKKHNLVTSDYNSRRKDCENAVSVLAKLFDNVKALRDVSYDELGAARSRLNWKEYRRALHVVGECARVTAGVKLLDEGDVAGFGRLWFDSHESSRLNFENSTPELDYLVSLAQSIPGCLGARLSGGGFGGITVHLVETEGAAEYAERVAAAYKKQTGIDPEHLICSIGNGAEAFTL